jgi:hypothetical protein
MSNRQEHKFSYKGVEVATAIDARCAYLRERIAHYTEEQLKVLEYLQENCSVEWREHDVTGGKQYDPVIVYDQERANWLRTCQQKIAQHSQTVEQLERIGRPYDHNAEAVFALDPDDVDFFHLGDADQAE